MKDHMTYRDEKQTYVASESLDRRLRTTELLLMANTLMMLIMMAAVLYAGWLLDRNNLLNQIKRGLEACRVSGWV